MRCDDDMGGHLERVEQTRLQSRRRLIGERFQSSVQNVFIVACQLIDEAVIVEHHRRPEEVACRPSLQPS